MKTSINIFLSLCITFSLFGQSNKKKKSVQHLCKQTLSTLNQERFEGGYFWHEEIDVERNQRVMQSVRGYAAIVTSSISLKNTETVRNGQPKSVVINSGNEVKVLPTLRKIYFFNQDFIPVVEQIVDEESQYTPIAFHTNYGEKKIIKDYIKDFQPNYKEPVEAPLLPFTNTWAGRRIMRIIKTKLQDKAMCKLLATLR